MQQHFKLVDLSVRDVSYLATDLGARWVEDQSSRDNLLADCRSVAATVSCR